MPADCPIQMRSKSFSLVNRLTAAHRHIVCDIWPLRVIPVASKTAVLDSNALGVPARYLHGNSAHEGPGDDHRDGAEQDCRQAELADQIAGQTPPMDRNISATGIALNNPAA